MPYKLLVFLSILAVLFTVYSLSCYFMNLRSWGPYLKAIIIANVSYCILTLLLVAFYFKQLSSWGIIYFLMEAAVVGVVVYVEVKVLSSTAEVSAGKRQL
jgi:hypothetical protein